MPQILVLNAGSSTLKFAVFEGVAEVERGMVEGTTLGPVLERLKGRKFTGVGHRIVHGGTRFRSPVRIDDHVLQELEKLRALAPLHLPFGLSVLREMRKLMPHVPHIACFDTAFHATQPDIATRLPVPRDYHERGYRRYGFHGLSYEHLVSALPKPLPRRLLAAHLGNGASLCAILDCKSVATTMGFSTADGLIMGTRTGAIDPGFLTTVMRDEKLDAAGLEDLIYRRGGLLGLSGISGDMRVLLASDAPEAKEAVEGYCYAAARQAGSMIMAMGGIDAMVFTGGVGENAEPVRSKILGYLDWLKPFHVQIIPANEELAMARHVRSYVSE